MTCSKVLVVNITHEPLSFVSVKRAVCLLLDGKAEMVGDAIKTIRSSSIAMKVSSVIRLTKYVRVPYKKALAFTRRGVLRRDKYKCGYCGDKATTVDHIIPKSRSGEDSWENTIACCRSCNQKKGNKTIAEIGWRLLRVPHAPAYKSWVLFELKNNDTWKDYIS